MNVHNNLILVKGIDKTQEIESCKYDINQHKYFIKFNTSPQEYPYGSSNVTWLKNPKIIKPDSVKISHNGTVFFDMQDIFDFDEYYRIIFGNGKTGLYMKSNIKIEKNSLHNDVIRSSFEYFKELADKISIKTDEGKNLLLDQYEKIDFISSDSALSIFLQPDINMPKICSSPSLYFPFGCNLSQMQAVQKAFSNKISVIEGPPGTGKTQTILNIVANAIINGKTVAVVSNNNSATDNVLEKLDKNGFGFIAAPLGNSDNKNDFIKNQTQYPDLSGYKYNADKIKDLCSKTISLQRELKEMLAAQNRIADLKRQLSAIKLEKQYFDDYYRETNEYSFKLSYVGFFLFCIIIVELRMVFYKNLRRKNMVGDIVTVTVDRAMGTYHPEHPNMYYPINYGYIEGVMAPDGEEQDAYILGVIQPTKKFNGKIIAIVHRNDDVEEKWVVAPMNMTFTKKEIEEQIYFQEQYFDSEIWC